MLHQEHYYNIIHHQLMNYKLQFHQYNLFHLICILFYKHYIIHLQYIIYQYKLYQHKVLRMKINMYSHLHPSNFNNKLFSKDQCHLQQYNHYINQKLSMNLLNLKSNLSLFLQLYMFMLLNQCRVYQHNDQLLQLYKFDYLQLKHQHLYILSLQQLYNLHNLLTLINTQFHQHTYILNKNNNLFLNQLQVYNHMQQLELLHIQLLVWHHKIHIYMLHYQSRRQIHTIIYFFL